MQQSCDQRTRTRKVSPITLVQAFATAYYD